MREVSLDDSAGMVLDEQARNFAARSTFYSYLTHCHCQSNTLSFVSIGTSLL